MRLVHGEFVDDCGAAALATWASVSYDTAYDAIWPGEKPREDRTCPECGSQLSPHGTWPRQISRAIKRLGLGRWRYRRTNDWTSIPNASIVCVAITENGARMLHWLVKSRSGRMLCRVSPRKRKLPANYEVVGYLERA